MLAEPDLPLSDKAAWRNWGRRAREALPAQARRGLSAAIHERLLTLPELTTAVSVFCYVSVGNEVQTPELIRALLRLGKTVAAPRVVDSGQMEAHRILTFEQLEPGTWGIPQPPAAAPLVDEPQIALTPGLVFSEDRARIGRGAGYYDRYLSRHPGTLAIGLAFECQLVRELVAQPHDVPLFALVTEARVIR